MPKLSLISPEVQFHQRKMLPIALLRRHGNHDDPREWEVWLKMIGMLNMYKCKGSHDNVCKSLAPNYQQQRYVYPDVVSKLKLLDAKTKLHINVNINNIFSLKK